jgi:hypothetical protein
LGTIDQNPGGSWSTPDFKTIANFRKDELSSRRVVGMDGSKFKAVNNRDRNFTSAKMKRRMEQITESIDRCLSHLSRVSAARSVTRRLLAAKVISALE